MQKMLLWIVQNGIVGLEDGEYTGSGNESEPLLAARVFPGADGPIP
jgi:hypothetical protein